jgi:hypothetical protein
MSTPGPTSGPDGENLYSVHVEGEGEDGWRVVIVDPAGQEASERPFSHETDARAYASTVRQHIYWLSEPKFRRQYRLPEREG